jgi:hypothetical protein
MNSMLRPHRRSKSSFWIELEERVLIKYLRLKGLKPLDIHHELVLTFGGEVCTLASVKHGIHELQTGQITLADKDRPGNPSVDHIDMLILKALGESIFL